MILQNKQVSKALMFPMICFLLLSILSNSQTTCNNGQNGCTTCLNSNTCQTCDTDFTKTDGVCQADCDVSNCGKCVNPNECHVCDDGFSVLDNKCISCSDKNCDLCSSENFCSDCTGSLTAFEGKCFSCDVNGCDVCHEDNVCHTCAQGFTSSGEGLCLTECSIANCSVCETAKKCDKCDTGFLPVDILNSSCVSCTIGNCKTCHANSTCSLCHEDFQLNTDKCILCTIPYCKTCNLNSTCSVCDTGYVKDSFGFCNKECSSFCTKCYMGVCYNCSSGYTLSPADSQCYKCSIDNCAYCSSDNICGGCNSQFSLFLQKCNCDLPFHISTVNNVKYCSCPASQTYVASTNTCNPNCNISSCITCKSSTNVCSKCLDGYKLASNGKSCFHFPVIEYCKTYDIAGICSECEGVLYPSAAGDECILCNILYCESCYASGECAACTKGYVLDSTKKQCVVCDTANCLSCSTKDNYCMKCAENYAAFDGKCVLCLPPCNTCNLDGTCATCKLPFNSLPSNGNCITCGTPNCATCQNQKTNSACSVCKSGFYKTTNGTCSPSCSQVNCISCAQSNSTICLTCTTGYYANISTGQCILCTNTPSCMTCNANNPSQCTMCAPGFFITRVLNNLTAVSATCSPCPSYCLSCTNATYCNILKNPSGEVLVKVKYTTILAKCDPGCMSCSDANPSYCKTCMPGFFYYDGICKPCGAQCMSCTPGNMTYCTSCFPNHYLTDNSTCKSCDKSCATCKSDDLTYCTSCPSGQELNLDGKCIKNSSTCQFSCATCRKTDNGNTYCAQCDLGFTLINGKCAPCIAGCNSCSNITISTCLSCAPGLMLYQSFNSTNGATSMTCKACSPFCAMCKMIGSQSVCQYCMVGYYVNSAFGCSADCSYQCATCNLNNPGLCTSCIAGYTLNSASISGCANDLACNSTSSCYVCPIGYSLMNTSCFQCASASNCARCYPMTPSWCTSCKVGYYLKVVMNNTSTGVNGTSSTCVQCPTGCKTCRGESACTTCMSGYVSLSIGTSTVNVPNANSIVQCIKCNSPCRTCYNDPDSCITCLSGFTQKGSDCVSNFNFGFSIVYNVDIQTFYNNYDNFLTEILSDTNLTTADVIILSITSGSTDVTGQVSSPYSQGTTQANNLQTQLNSNLRAGVTGLGTPTSVSFSVNGQTTNDDDSGLSETDIIILATVIPITVVIIITIIVVCYCVKKKRQENLQTLEKKMDPEIEVNRDMELTNQPMMN